MSRNIKEKLAILVFLSFFISLSGCSGQKACSSDFECPLGSSCIEGKCSEVQCKALGEKCTNDYDCCGQLECSGGKCHGSPGNLPAEITMEPGAQARVYGAEITVGNVSLDFGQECEIRNPKVEIGLSYNGESNRNVLSKGSSISAGGARAEIVSIFGSSSQESCIAHQKSALIAVERKADLSKIFYVGETAQVPGTTAQIKLNKITPLYMDTYIWSPYSLNEGQMAPERGSGGLSISEISGEISGCDATGKTVSFSTPGSKATLSEGETNFIGEKIVKVDSIIFFPDGCSSPAKPIVKFRVADVPCTYPRVASIDVISQDGSHPLQLQSGKPEFFEGSELVFDPQDGPALCLTQNPLIRVHMLQKGEQTLLENESTTFFGDFSVRLGSLSIANSDPECNIAGASAFIEAKQTDALNFESKEIDLNSSEEFGSVVLKLASVNGVFTKRTGVCVLEKPGAILSVYVPSGAGGPFVSRERAGGLVFIEKKVKREETAIALDDTCPGFVKNEPSAYSFDETKRALFSQGLGPEMKVAFGVSEETITIIGASGSSSFLYGGDAIPFSRGGLSILGVNKFGDAMIVSNGIPMIIASGVSTSFSSKKSEQILNCSIIVNTNETITNWGFVKAVH